jgi:hypothetical protein
MRNWSALILSLSLVSCAQPGGGLSTNVVHGTGSVAEELSENGRVFVLRSDDGRVFNLEHESEKFKRSGLLVEFVGYSEDELKLGAAAQDVQFLKLAVVGTAAR